MQVLAFILHYVYILKFVSCGYAAVVIHKAVAAASIQSEKKKDNIQNYSIIFTELDLVKYTHFIDFIK